MPSNTTSAVSGADTGRLRQEILHRLLKVGCACIPDLVNEVKDATSAADLKPVIDSLLKEGLIRPLKDPADPRRYGDGQTVYELVR